MPKGFLVKRSKRTGPASYRVREEANPTQDLPCRAPALPTDLHNFAQRTPARCCYSGLPEFSFYAPSLSPTRPDSEGYTNQHPVHQQPELFPEPLLGSFAINGSPVSPSLPETTCQDPASACFSEPPVATKKRAAPDNQATTSKKQRKSSGSSSSSSSSHDRRSTTRDEVTTSPVLGLRIKEEEPEEDLKRNSGSSVALGEFVCQLCKERYPDPLSLAHHKCSRIVRVEYRCDECDKAFSCPANLASHRRWHKPKGAGLSDAESRLSPRPQQSSPPPEDDTPFGCPQCSKRFRRQAYLRKHLALHGRKAANANQAPSAPLSAAEPRLRTPELSPELSSSGSTAETARAPAAFPCRFCGEHFFSSPGLTRHINQHHPTESRQIIMLSHLSV
ncbi:insulinoma-associated protein 1a-like [Salminus brasiliensis]|uniref:insulinoma-associated protein 1a-like n=1 Tax=Salminus brasiliensis TaxID=930266 RepID=UPI003B82E855